MNFLLLEKLQGFVNILQAVNTHAAFGGPWLWEAEGKEALVLKWLTKRNHTTFIYGPEGKKKPKQKHKNTQQHYRILFDIAHISQFTIIYKTWHFTKHDNIWQNA